MRWALTVIAVGSLAACEAPHYPQTILIGCNDKRVADDCLTLGEAYLQGDNRKPLPYSRVEARLAFEKACELGNVTGCERLLDRHQLVWQKEERARVVRRGCELGSRASCRAAGDDARLAKLLVHDCDADKHWDACNELGELTASGRGVSRDYVRARALFEGACAAKLPTACVNLAGLFERGLGGAKDLARADELYRASRAMDPPCFEDDDCSLASCCARRGGRAGRCEPMASAACK